MKQLICEMCGGIDLIKQDGVIVCQSCGIKYSLEEARKIMIENTVNVKGTVEIDTSKELANLYQIARCARDDNNAESAAKFYDMILVKEPSSWEAYFYSTYFKAAVCEATQIQWAAASICNCLGTVLKLIKDNMSVPEEQKRHIPKLRTVL